MRIVKRNIKIRGSTSSDVKEESILVLDDDAHYVDLMSAALSNFGNRFNIIEAQSVAEAKQKINDRRVKVFIIDVQLPDGTGLDFYDSVRDQHPGAVAIVVTGTSLIADENFTERFGVDQLIRKPFRLGLLRELVGSLLSDQQRDGEGTKQPATVVKEASVATNEGHFAGVLKKLTITDIVQLKCISRASTVISLRSEGGKVGKIHLSNGQIFHAETDDTSGLDALYQIVMWDSGKVSESQSVADAPVTVEGSWESLLMNAMHHKDEVQRMPG